MHTVPQQRPEPPWPPLVVLGSGCVAGQFGRNQAFAHKVVLNRGGFHDRAAALALGTKIRHQVGKTRVPVRTLYDPLSDTLDSCGIGVVKVVSSIVFRSSVTSANLIVAVDGDVDSRFQQYY